MNIYNLQASIAVVFLFLAEISCAQEEARLSLKTYPGNLTVQENSDAVIDCRDEGPLRAQVQWLRGKRVQVSQRGRLIVQHVQVRHAGTYTCRAIGFSKTFPGAEVTVRLQVVNKHGGGLSCTPLEARCANGECVPREFVCDGEFDCSDGSDELRCRPRPGPRPRTPTVAELRAPAACGKDEAPCRNGRCIAINLFCDGEFDCVDASDELHCNKTSQGSPPVAELRAPVACGKDEAPCRNGRCIAINLFCDGEFDCVDASDELHCNKTSQHVTSDMRRQGAAENEVVDALVRRPKAKWSEWSPWSTCNARCERARGRECGAARRQADCEGEATQRQKCPMKDCQVDGGWSPWTAWTSCSESCGRGTRRRYRRCDSPAPNYGGAYCSGSDGQQENCIQARCAFRGQWGPWGSWSTCSRGRNGTRLRKRVCEIGGADCRGADRQESACKPCPRNLKIGMKPVRLTVPRGRLVNLTCHYRRRGDDPLSLELDLPAVTHSNEVIKGGNRYIVIKDSLTATRCGARRRWTLLLGREDTRLRCLVRDSEGRVLGKAESKVVSVSSNSVLCHGDKSCQTLGLPNKSWTKKLSAPSRNTKEAAIKKDIPQKTPLPSRRFGSPPRILQVHPSYQIVHQGESVHIACIVVGEPPLVVQWRADGRELAPHALVNGGVLHLREIRAADAGKYVCMARNSAGVAYSSAYIVVT